MPSVRSAAVVAAASALVVGGLVARAVSGGAAHPASTPPGPAVVVEPAAPGPASVDPRLADAPHPATAVPAADATGWPAPPPPFVLPEAPRASCESQSVPHPANFFVMRSIGTDDVGGSTHATYADHVTVQSVCDNATQKGDLALEIDLFPYGGDASHFDLTVGPSGLVVMSAEPGHGAQTIAVGRRIGAYPGACGTLSIAGAGATHASLDDRLCFDGAGRLTHAELHERSTLADGNTRRLDATFDAAG